MNPNDNLLLRAVVDPRSLVNLTAQAWDILLPIAHEAGVLSRIGVALDEMGVVERLPGRVGDQLDSARVLAVEHHRVMRWEVNRILHAVAELNTCIILLKGAAYCMAGLPPARGRLSSDVDIMVPKENIASVEQALLHHGWEHIKLDAYDQRYYRTWMHELPPLQHQKRKTVLDVHHTILPESGRLSPNSQLLFAEAQPISRSPTIKVLAPVDMVLHSAAHLFQDGELHQGLRELADLDDLLKHFGTDPGFWQTLVPRSLDLNLERPMFYALRYTHDFLGTSIPDHVVCASTDVKPPWPVLSAMDTVVKRTMIGESEHYRALGTVLARWALYIRSHWLRMPPWLLARHLCRKAFSKRSCTSSDDFVRYQ